MDRNVSSVSYNRTCAASGPLGGIGLYGYGVRSVLLVHELVKRAMGIGGCAK